MADVKMEDVVVKTEDDAGKGKGPAATKKRLEIKKWNAVSLWSWGKQARARAGVGNGLPSDGGRATEADGTRVSLLSPRFAPQTSSWTTAPSAETTSWICASSARRIRRARRVRSGGSNARAVSRSLAISRSISSHTPPRSDSRVRLSSFVAQHGCVGSVQPRVPLPLHQPLAQDAAGVSAGQHRVGVPKVRALTELWSSLPFLSLRVGSVGLGHGFL